MANEFLSSRELGLEKDDAAFMARFSSQLSLERQPAWPSPRRPLRRLFDFSELIVWSLAGALLLGGVWPLISSVLSTYLPLVAGFSPEVLLAVGAGIAILLWPFIEGSETFDINELL
jgi:hypothetical protein